MELVRFRENIYGRLQNHLFLWEPTWDSFRPIERYAWNGTSFEHVFLHTDIWDSYYGYGSLEMKTLCRKLLEETELETAKDISTFDAFWTWCRTPVEWFRDRRCAFTSCAAKDSVSWKKMIAYMHSKPKTIRHRIHSRVTKRMNRFIRK